MSDIILVKDTVEVKREVKTIMVPDCTPDLERANKMAEAAAIATAEANRIVEMTSKSIVEQVATYLYELTRPILEYYKDKTYGISNCYWVDRTGYNCSHRWELMPNEKERRELTFGYWCNGSEHLKIYLRPEGYLIDYIDSKDSEILTELTLNWRNFKGLSIKAVKECATKLYQAQQNIIAEQTRKAEILSGFEL